MIPFSVAATLVVVEIAALVTAVAAVYIAAAIFSKIECLIKGNRDEKV